MSKSITNQRLVYKIHSSRLRYNKWDMKLSFEEATKNEEIVSLGDSIALRMIRKITKNKVTDEEIHKLKKEIKEYKKQKKSFSEKLNDLNNKILEENYLLIVFDNDEDWNYCTNKNNEIKFNNKIFVRLVGTNGGIKNNTVVFINKEIHKEMDKRLNNGRKKSAKYVPAKFEAYKALAFSCSTEVTQPNKNGVLVVEDGHVNFIEKVLQLKGKKVEPKEYENKDGEKFKRKVKSNEFDLVEVDDYLVERDFTDGCGIILPSLSKQWAIDLGEYHKDENGNKVENYIPSGFNIRNAWTKGMVFTFPFDEYAEEIGETEVEDIWGKKHKVKNIQLVITNNMLKLNKEAYNSIDDYLRNCEKNGFKYCVTKMLPKELEETRNMNYQFLQSYEFSEEDLIKLLKPTIDDIYGVLGENDDTDYGKMLLFLKGNKIRKNDFINEEQYFLKALMINKEMINDPFVKQKVLKLIKKKIKDSKKGVIKVRGNYGIISGDLYGLCQHIFKREITGALKKNEFYNKTWLSKGVNKIVGYRSPMTIHNNIRILNLVENKITKKYFRYMKVVTVFNAWDTTCDALNGADFDGDAIISTDNEILLKNTKILPTVMCEQNSCKKQRITEQSLLKANKNGFGNEVGAITNRCTAMFDVLAKFEKDSKEYNEMLYRITCMQGYQQEIIDSCKGIVPKRVPKQWYNYKSLKEKENDTKEEKELKKYNRNLVANKKPYFFIYNYKYLKNEYDNYVKNSNNNCLIKFGKTIEELNTNGCEFENEKEFLNIYKALSPVSNNNSIVNRISHILEDKFDSLKIKIGNSNFDKSILLTNKKPKKEKRETIKEELINLYKNYNKEIQSIIKSNNNKVDTSVDDNNNSRKLYMNEIKKKAYDICDNDKEILCNILVNELYDNNNSKQFIWDICGDYIIEKLLKDNDNKINIPVKDKNGNINWNNINYSIKEIDLKEEN